ncbi:MAG: metal-dependent transcriptional regulator [Flavobacteriales bacterium]|nr:metal-dependent transcriptional regulator [Flavobacteriales bacterium]
MASETVENYIKCIFSLQKKSKKELVSTNAIAEHLNTKAISVTDMMKKLGKRKLVNYKKYHGVSLTKEGRKVAAQIIRRHRLWEVFLVDRLKYGWDEVHELAEELEHIDSSDLTNRLDEYLGYPKYDPHGDPIPNEEGEIRDDRESQPLSSLNVGDHGVVVGVLISSSEYLQYVDELKLHLGEELEVKKKVDFDKSMVISIQGSDKSLSHEFVKQLLVKRK